MRSRRVVALLLGVLAFVLASALSGCTPTVSVTPGPSATSAQCAGVIVRLPPSLDSAPKRETDAQGTAAYGDPQSVVVRCGVDPVPSTLCQTVGGVDWSIRGTPTARPTRYVATTFGRAPATEVVIDNTRISATTALQGIAPAVSDAIRASARCTSGTAGPPATATP